MNKILLVSLLAVLCAASNAAPVVVTPGSNAGYLYFPKGSAGSNNSRGPLGGGSGVTIDGMQLAATACYTTSGAVVLPTGFTTGFIQAIIVGGGEGVGWNESSFRAGQNSSITHAAIGTITALGGSSTAAGSRGGAAGQMAPEHQAGGGGGGGGGYLGVGGRGRDGYSPGSMANGGQGGGTAGGGGQGFGYGGAEGGRGGQHAGKDGSAISGAVGIAPNAPASIPCPNTPSAAGAPFGGTGFGAGEGGLSPFLDSGPMPSTRGGNSGQINTVVWRYEGGPITVVVGAGGGGGAPGVVALRFIPQ